MTVCSSRLLILGEIILATKKQSTPTKKTSDTSSKTTVTRIKAVDTETKKAATKPTEKVVKATKPKGDALSKVFSPFTAAAGYFKGAWYELKQVRWPTRRATWGLTGAVLVFSLFFVVLILLLDAAFKYLFDIILGK